MDGNIWYQDQKETLDAQRVVFDDQMAKIRVAEYRREEMDNSEPSALDTFTAAFSLYNPITSFIVNDPLPDTISVPGYNPYDGDEIKGYERYWQSFLESNSPDTTIALKTRIDREMRNREILAQSSTGIDIAATVVATLSNPLEIALIGTPAGWLLKGGRLASAGRSAAAGAAVVGTSELALDATQETREQHETLTNLAIVTTVDALLGGAFGRLATKAERAIVEKDVRDTFSGAMEVRHAGAAQAGWATGSEMKRATAFFKYTGLEYLGRQMMKVTPLGRVLTSDNFNTRRLGQDLAESAIHLEQEGGPAAVETLIKLDMRKADTDIQLVRGLQRESGMDEKGFSVALLDAMRLGDVSDNPAIEKAAKALRRTQEDLWQRAADARIEGSYIDYVEYVDDAGVSQRVALDTIDDPNVRRALLEKGEKVTEPRRSNTANGYVQRLYDLSKVRQNPLGFRAAWRAGLTEMIGRQQREGQAALDAYITSGGTSARQLRALEREIPAMPDEERWDEMLIDIYEKVANLKVGDIHAEVGPAGAAMLKRRVDIQDEFVRDYLIDDWERLHQTYVKNISSRVRLAERFGEGEGDFMMRGEFTRMEEQFAAARTQLEEAGDIKGAQAITAKSNKELRDLRHLRDSLLGRNHGSSYADPANQTAVSMMRSLRGWNVATKLNSVLLASMPDAARVMTYNGGKDFAPALSSALKNLRLSAVPENELIALTQVAERVSGVRLQQYSDVDDALPLTRYERNVRKVSDTAMTLSGIRHWNSTLKGVVAGMANNRIVRAIKDGEGDEWLARSGIDSTLAPLVRREINKHATYETKIWNMNLDRWDSREAMEAVEAVVIKEADRVIVTPGVGDRPIFMTTELGKTMFQFKTFIAAAMNRFVVPLMQEEGGRKWAEIHALMAIGGLSYYTSQLAVGREPSTDPAFVLREAIDRSGLAGYALELYNVGNKVAGYPLGDVPTRYRSRDVMGTLLGPTAGTMSEVLKSVQSGTNTDSRVHAIRRLLPAQNHFLIRRPLDVLEGEIAKGAGGTGKFATPQHRGDAVEAPPTF